MPATRLRIFVSSVQKEFQQIRLDLKAFLLGDAVLRRFVSEVFLFEELPAGDRRADQVYLDEVKRCDVYLGIFGYGQERCLGKDRNHRQRNVLHPRSQRTHKGLKGLMNQTRWKRLTKGSNDSCRPRRRGETLEPVTNTPNPPGTE